MLIDIRRGAILAAAIVLALPAGAPAAPLVNAFYSLPEKEDEVLVVFALGPNVRAKRAIVVDRTIARRAYRAAWASARQPDNHAREVNVFFFSPVDLDAFEPFGGVPLAIYGVGAGARIRTFDALWSLYVPYRAGVMDPSAIARVPMPRFARRAAASLIDTSTGEVAWADEIGARDAG